METASKVLVSSLSHAKVQYPELYDFLIANCSHLISTDAMTSYVELPLLDIKALEFIGNYHNLQDKSIIQVSSQYTKDGGCYYFFDQEGNPVFIGSTMDYLQRAYNHMAELGRNPRPKLGFYRKVLAMGGFKVFNWAPIYKLPNYITLYTKEVGTPELGVKAILELFTVFQNRAVEQAYIKHYVPMYNGLNNVSFGFKWHPDAPVRMLGDAAPTNVITELLMLSKLPKKHANSQGLIVKPYSLGIIEIQSYGVTLRN